MTLSLAFTWQVIHATPMWILAGFTTGSLLLCFGSYALFRSVRYRRWKVAEGEISESYLQKRKSNDKYGCHVYDPFIRYSYLSGGRKYFAHTVSPHRTAQPTQKGAMLTAAYPVGKKVSVYHHPSRPELALLQPAPWQNRLVMTAVGLLLVTGFGTLGLHNAKPWIEVATVQQSVARTP